jgi:hypothetical protein
MAAFDGTDREICLSIALQGGAVVTQVKERRGNRNRLSFNKQVPSAS